MVGQIANERARLVQLHRFWGRLTLADAVPGILPIYIGMIDRPGESAELILRYPQVVYDTVRFNELDDVPHRVWRELASENTLDLNRPWIELSRYQPCNSLSLHSLKFAFALFLLESLPLFFGERRVHDHSTACGGEGRDAAQGREVVPSLGAIRRALNNDVANAEAEPNFWITRTNPLYHRADAQCILAHSCCSTIGLEPIASNEEFAYGFL